MCLAALKHPISLLSDESKQLRSAKIRRTRQQQQQHHQQHNGTQSFVVAKHYY